MIDRKRVLLIAIDVAGLALTAVGAALSLIPWDFVVQYSLRHPETDWLSIYLAGMDAGASALFLGIALVGFSAYRRRLLRGMLLLAAVLLVVMLIRGGFDGAIAIAIPTVAWMVVLGVSAPQRQQVTRGCVSGLFLAGALVLLLLGYLLPILLAPFRGLGGHSGPASSATSSEIASSLVPFAIIAVCLVALAVFILKRRKDV